MRSPRLVSPSCLLAASLLIGAGCGDSKSTPEPAAEPDEATPSAAETPAADSAGPAKSGGDEGEAGEPAAAPEPEPEPEVAVMAPPPDPASLTLHALAAYEIVTLYAKPDMSSTKLGYLRLGHRTMVTPKIDDQGEGCRKGWHQLAGGSYACASKGLTVAADKAPYMHQPPPRPRVDEPMPYDYAIVARNGTEMWWRPADALERELSAEKFAMAQHKEAVAAALAAGEPPPPKPDFSKPKPKPKAETGGTDEPAAKLPGIDDIPDAPPAPPTPEEIAERERKEAEARKRAEEEAARAEEERQKRIEKMANLPLHPEHPYLEKGFIITAALKIKDQGRTWWRTSRGGYLDTRKAYKKKDPKVLELGQEIAETTGFPFGFVDDDRAPVFEKNAAGKLQRVRSIEYRTFVDGVEQVEVDGREYLRTAEDAYVRVSDLRVAVPQTPPEELGELDRWIDVSLEQQLLVAYEGEHPVFATLVSTGRKGTEEEPFDTPKGSFRIQTKHISSSMDGNTASDGAYSIQDVPWAMFFHGNYALHGAFWHSRFGSRRSHGCINLAPGDARWLFWWVGPDLPEGWHGAAAHDDAPGSLVVVR